MHFPPPARSAGPCPIRHNASLDGAHPVSDRPARARPKPGAATCGGLRDARERLRPANRPRRRRASASRHPTAYSGHATERLTSSSFVAGNRSANPLTTHSVQVRRGLVVVISYG